jgi:Tfp pilus assembly protein PilV
MNKTRRQNQSGLSLVELMIAGAVLSVLAIAFSQYMFNVSKQQKQAENKMEIMMINQQFNTASVDAESLYQSGVLVASQTSETTQGDPLPERDSRFPPDDRIPAPDGSTLPPNSY